MSPLISLLLARILLAFSLIALAIVFRHRLQNFFSRAKMQVNGEASQWAPDLLAIGFCFGLAVFMALAFAPTGMFINLGISLVAAFLLPAYLHRKRKKKYVLEFDRSLAESLTTICSSLRAGLTLKDAFTVAVDNCPAPFSLEISQVLRDYRFGVSLDDGLEALRHRIGTVDCRIAFGAIIVGNKLGGRLPEILEKIIKTIRERERVEGRLRSLTAQGRSQAFLLCSAPPVLGLGLYFYDPNKMALMTGHIVGQTLLALAVILELIGIFATMKVMKLDV